MSAEDDSLRLPDDAEADSRPALSLGVRVVNVSTGRAGIAADVTEDGHVVVSRGCILDIWPASEVRVEPSDPD